MRLFDINGRLVNKNVSNYIINWDKKSRSNVQFLTKQFLRPFWQSQIVYEEFPCFGTLLKVDILNATLKIAVEVHGKQHESFNSFFHNGNPANYLKGIKNDFKKIKWLEKNNFKLVEIMEDEVPKLNKQFFLEKFDLKL
jgi:hypothetical protein